MTPSITITPGYPLSATSAAKDHLIELIMAVEGKGQPNPREYRRILNTRSVEELQAMVNEWEGR